MDAEWGLPLLQTQEQHGTVVEVVARLMVVASAQFGGRNLTPEAQSP